MKKLIALVALATAFGVRADSYLYWMVGDSVSMKSGETTTKDFSGYKYAAVGVWNATTGESAGYLNLFGSNGADLGTTIGMKGSSFYANLASFTETGYSFYIELFNDSGSVGRSEQMLTYSEALAYATSFGTGTPAYQPWTPSSFTTAAVPEPSSALLMLLGCAGLALKRKKQAKA